MNFKLRVKAISTVLGVLMSGGSALAGGARTSVNRNTNINSNTNINRNTNVNVNRDVNVNVNVNHGYVNGCCYHPVAAAAAVTTAAVITAAVVGSMVHTLPPACTAVVVNGVTFQQCGSSWYQPQFSGTTVTYIVVNPPR